MALHTVIIPSDYFNIALTLPTKRAGLCHMVSVFTGRLYDQLVGA